MQFKGIQVAALLAALSTVGLAAPVAEANAIAARDDGYGSLSTYGDYFKQKNYAQAKCDDSHTIKGVTWTFFTYNGHKIRVITFNKMVFTVDHSGKWYIYNSASRNFAPCKDGEYDFSYVPYVTDGYYVASYGAGYSHGGNDYGYGNDHHSDSDSDSDDDYHTDDGYHTDDDVYGNSDVITYFNKFDWNSYKVRYAKFNSFAVTWRIVKIGRHTFKSYIDGGKEYCWIKLQNGFVPFVHGAHGWHYASHYNRRPSNWCDNDGYAQLNYFAGSTGYSDPSRGYGSKNYGSDSDHGYGSDSDHGYGSDSDHGYGSVKDYFNHLQYDSAVHAIFFMHNNIKVFVAKDNFYYYKNGQCVPYTAIKFNTSYIQDKNFVSYLSRYPNAYTDRARWVAIKVAKHSGYGSGSDSDNHGSDDSDCSDSEDEYDPKSKGYGYDPKSKSKGYGYDPKSKSTGYGYDPKSKSTGYGYDPKGNDYGYGSGSKNSY